MIGSTAPTSHADCVPWAFGTTAGRYCESDVRSLRPALAHTFSVENGSIEYQTALYCESESALLRTDTPSRDDRIETGFRAGGCRYRQLSAGTTRQWRLPAVKILNDHLETASAAWQAYRASTPQDWFNLLSQDLTILPRLRQAVVELLEELPWRTTGLGATEMRMFELISEGHIHPFELFPPQSSPAAGVRLLGDRIAAGRVGSWSGTRCIRPRRGSIHGKDARGP